MDKLRNPKTLRILEAVIGSFVGMIVALAWNSFIDSILTPLRQKFAFLGILGYLVYAIVISFVAVLVVISYVHFIEKLEDENKKPENS